MLIFFGMELIEKHSNMAFLEQILYGPHDSKTFLHIPPGDVIAQEMFITRLPGQYPMKKTNFDLFKSLAGELDPQTLRKKFLHALLELQNVRRGSIWIKKENHYHCIEAAGKERDAIIGIDIDADQPSIVGWVIENGQHTVADPKSDERHYKELEENLAIKSSLILCFPLFLKDKTVYGAVQIIDITPEKSCVNLDEALSQLPSESRGHRFRSTE